MRLIGSLLVLLLGAPAFADLLNSQGVFEAYLDTNNGGSVPAGTFTYSQLSSGDSSLTGWTVGGAGIDLIRTYWTPHGGIISIDLAASGDGSLSRTLTTEVGQNYELRFWMAGIPTGGPNVKTMDITMGSTTVTGVSFDATGSSTTSMGWVEMVFKWTATSTSSTLQFTSTSGTASGAALDDLSVTATPEPGTLAFFGLGLGALGLWRRRVARAARSAAKS